MSLTEPPISPNSPASTLALTQTAPTLLAAAAPTSSFPPLAFLTSTSTPETYLSLEKLVIASLQTGDEKTAFLALEALTTRFGPQDPRVMGLRGLYQEAQAKNIQDLQKVVNEYNKILTENPMNVPIHKRRIALTRSLNQDEDAAIALVDFLGSFPSDTEAWSELSDVYFGQGLAAQAIFCLEEALLAAPNAWNLHARLGELECCAAAAEPESSEARRRYLSGSIRRFARSVELCDDYVRGYYGLAMATRKMGELPQGGSKTVDSDAVDPRTARELHDVAIRKLKTIVADWSKSNRPGVNEAEIIAAKQMLDISR